MASNKVFVDRVEETHSGHSGVEMKDGPVARHGDTALAFLGNERVSLTDEDVRMSG